MCSSPLDTFRLLSALRARPPHQRTHMLTSRTRPPAACIKVAYMPAGGLGEGHRPTRRASKLMLGFMNRCSAVAMNIYTCSNAMYTHDACVRKAVLLLCVGGIVVRGTIGLRMTRNVPHFPTHMDECVR